MVTVSTGTVTNTSGSLWAITNAPSGTNIVATVTNANGCTNQLTVTAPNSACPVVSAPNSGGDKSYCVGDIVPSITASVGLGETVDWYDSASGGTLLLLDNTTYTPIASGTFYAEARNRTINCLSGARTAITLTQDTPTMASIGPDQFVFTGANAIFTVTTTNADTYQWQVSIDGERSSTIFQTV